MIRKRIIKKHIQYSSGSADPRAMKISLPKEPWLPDEVSEEVVQEPVRPDVRKGPRHIGAFQKRNGER